MDYLHHEHHLLQNFQSYLIIFLKVKVSLL
jgi:hypothetical protein